MALLRRREKHFVLAGFIVSLALCTSVLAQVSASESQVKAAFVENFARFVEWPRDSLPAPSSPLVIAVIGDDPIRGALDDIRGKLANGHPIEVRHLGWDANLRGIHIVFISASEEHHLAAVLESCQKGPVLTVSDLDRFSLSGGIIELRMVGNRVRFDINRSVASAAHLNISSKLLSVARAVHTERIGDTQ
jgi:hypothetical protein